MNQADPVAKVSDNTLIKDAFYMQRCLDLARSGLGFVAPNPLVGSVLVVKDRIIGEGYHRLYGKPHAEPNAIASVKDKSLLRHATLYVNLEPCSHTGKTPPCTSLIIASGIKRVVVGTTDSNELVKGKGIAELRKSGCQVDTGVLEKESRFLNRRFFTFHEKKRPYIILKWAQTLDGYIDILPRTSDILQPTWITSEKLRMLVHKWRSEEPAIMIGTNTAARDNPRLNVRDWSGKQPLRLVIDKKLVLPASLHLFDQSQTCIIFNSEKDDIKGQTQWVRLPFDSASLWPVLKYLHTQNIQSVFVEGGQKLLQSFIDQGLWDEARVFVGSQLFGKGVAAPALGRMQPSPVFLGKECFYRFQNTYDGNGQAE